MIHTLADRLTGLPRLMWLIGRRDRVRILLWVSGVTALVALSGSSLQSVYSTPASIRSYVEVAGGNPALVAFAGPGHGFDDPNIGVVLVNETLLWGAISAALMSIFVVVRHTRAEEESERADLLRSGVVGRHAVLSTALLVAAAMNVGVAVLIVPALVVEGYPIRGSVALAAGIAGSGLVFAAIAALASQIVSTSRGALGLASGVLGIAFAIRAFGDIGENPASWISPLGWAPEVRPFAGERWWTLVISLFCTVAVSWTAYALSTRRDLGSGLITSRRGPAQAAPWIIAPVGLAWRLQRGSILGWCTGLVVTGLVFGAVGNDVERLVEDNPDLADFLTRFGGSSITDAYFVTAIQMMALLASGFAVASLFRARSEEVAGRAELIIATPTSRTRWWLGQVGVTVGGTVMVTASGGVGAGMAYAVVTGDAGQFPRLVVATLVTLAASFVLIGLALALYGVAPRLQGVTWAVFAGLVVIGILAETLRIPDWIRSVSPFEQLPEVPARTVDAGPLLVLSAIAIVLAAAGWMGFCRRDLATT